MVSLLVVSVLPVPEKIAIVIFALAFSLFTRVVFVWLHRKAIAIPLPPIDPQKQLDRLVSDWERRAGASAIPAVSFTYKTCAAELRTNLNLRGNRQMRLKDVPYPQLLWDKLSVDERRTICLSGNDSTRLRSHALAATLWEGLTQADREILWQVDFEWAKSRRKELEAD
jgi:hypothetical protein